MTAVQLQRVAFKMKLKQGYAEEYKKRHDALWPELQALLSQSGIHDYSIFFDEEAHTLFAVHKLSREAGSGAAVVADELGSNPIVQRWWAHMADIMETNEDNSPITEPLREMFHLA